MMKANTNYRRLVCVWGNLFIIIVLLITANAQDTRPRQRQDRFKQPPTDQTMGEINAPGVVVSPNEDHRIGPGDVVEVQVNMAPELSNTFRVTSDGTFLMPVIGRVIAQKKTSEELSEEIAQKLKGDYLKTPIVKIIIRQIYSHTYFIQGAVRRSGVYQVEGKPTLLELITVGGGLAENHGTTAFIIRRIKNKQTGGSPPANNKEHINQESLAGNPAITDRAAQETATFEMTKVNIAGLLKGRFDQNTILEPGDIVNVPPSDVFFVAGEVREPGSFPLKDGTTLRQAISLAQGTTPKAAGNRGLIYREGADGQRQEIKIDVDAIMKGKKEDILLLANDIIILPNSALKSTALPILNAFGTGVAWAVGGRIPGR